MESQLINVAAVGISALALFVSYLSWHASMLSVRAATFDQRFEIYTHAERFLATWIRDARPDLGQLGLITGAWSRSHFLCDESVTRYLRKVWVDGVRANYLHRVMTGEIEGNHQQAVEEFHKLLSEHTTYDTLRATFMDDLKVQTSVFRLPRRYKN